jgi:Domain of unknown function (DUF4412)
MTRALTVALCLAAVPALAFEGIIETKMTMNRGKGDGAPEGTPTSFSGTGTITVKGLNSRMEQQVNVPGMSGNKTVVIYRSDQKTTYILNTASKTYSKHATEKEDDDSEASKWTVKKLGKDTVAGRSTEHVQVQKAAGGGDVLEVWIDKNLVSASDLEKAFNAGGHGQSGWWGALRKEGVAGIPLKVVSHNSKGEPGVTWEATSVKSQSVPDSAFSVPADYTESKGYGGMGAGGDAQKQREQMMQQLTPEQRKQVEEMMKKYQGGSAK